MKRIRNPDVDALKEALRACGIQTEEQLEKALSETLDRLEIGIMTERLSIPAPEKTA